MLETIEFGERARVRATADKGGGCLCTNTATEVLGTDVLFRLRELPIGMFSVRSIGNSL